MSSAVKLKIGGNPLIRCAHFKNFRIETMFEKMPPKIVFWLYITSILAAIFALMLVNNSADLDLWGRLATGALILQSPAFPYRDPFSYTAFHHAWMDHEWGSGVIFYALFRAFGSTSLLWLKLTLLLLTVWSLAKVFLLQINPEKNENSHRSNQSSRMVYFMATLVLTLPMILPHYSATIRCHQFSFLFYVLSLWLLEAFRLKSKTFNIWLMPILMLFWVNLHAGFALGFFAIISYVIWLVFANRRTDALQLTGILILCLLTTLINPYGLAFHRYLIEAWSLPRTGISEWGNVFSALGTWGGGFYSAWFLACILLITTRIFRDKQSALREAAGPMLLLLATGVEGWLHAKLAPFFILSLLAIGIPLIPTFRWNIKWQLPALWRQRFVDTAYVLMPVGLLISAIFISSSTILNQPDSLQVQVRGHASPTNPKSAVIYPNGAIAFMQRQQLTGNLWVLFDWGEFALWNLYPNLKVSLDGRYEELYPERIFRDNEQFFGKANNLSLAEQYKSDYILLPAANKKIIEALNQSSHWRCIYRDETALIYGFGKSNTNSITEGRSKNASLDDLIGNLNRFNLKSQ